MARRKGFLTTKTFFPRTGDVYLVPEDPEVPMWTCARANQFVDEQTGDKVRYALITANHPEMGILDRTVSESTDMEEFLEEFDSINRKGKDYKKDEKGLFVEVE